MAQCEKVFITGFSALSAAGHNVDEHWNAVNDGVSKISECKSYDISSWENQLSGEISNFDWRNALPDRKLLKLISKQDIIGLYAAYAAADHAQLTPILEKAQQNDIHYCDRTGVYVGSPGNKYFQQYDFLPLMAESKGDMSHFSKNLFEHVHPMWLLRILPNNVLAYTGIQLGCKGPNHNFTNHAVGGMQALIEAYWAIRQGLADRIIVVAYDIATEPQARFYYDELGVLSSSGIAPFSTEHNGTVLAEGAAALVLENENSMNSREVKPIVEMMGGRFGSEALGLFSLDEAGAPLAELITDSLTQFGLEPRDIQAVVAHANGNQKSDISEARAITKVFGQKSVPVTGFKWLMGHSLCAAGLLDVVLTAKSLSAM